MVGVNAFWLKGRTIIFFFFFFPSLKLNKSMLETKPVGYIPEISCNWFQLQLPVSLYFQSFKVGESLPFGFVLGFILCGSHFFLLDWGAIIGTERSMCTIKMLPV